MFALVFLLFLVFQSPLDAKVCRSPRCVQSSEYILSKMDLTADPCDDFYQYTCGNWVNATDIPEGKESYNTLQVMFNRNVAKLKAILDEGNTFLNGTHSVALEKVHNFYQLCLNEKEQDKKGIQEVAQFILDMFSWNVTSSFGVTWSEKSWDFQTALTVNHAYGFSAFFKSSIDNISKTIKFTQRERKLSIKALRKNLNFGLKVGELLGGNSKSVKEEMTKVIGLQVKLSKLSKTKNSKSMVNNINSSSLQALLGSTIDVTTYLQDRFGDFNISEFEINVANTDYFRNLHSVILNSPKSTLANYIVWNAMSKHLAYFPLMFRQTYRKVFLDEKQQRIRRNRSRKDYCFDLFHRTGILSIALYALFIEKSPFSKESKNEIYTIVREVRNAFQREVAMLPWLDDDTKQWVIEKASYIETNIGYLDWIDSATSLDKLYKDIQIIPGHFLQSSLNVRMVEEGYLPGKVNDWRLLLLLLDKYKSVLIANAFYMRLKNEFFIAAGILQKPIFTNEFPMSFNFGSIGFITAHEITHGFDNHGILYDKNGNPSLWWKNQTAYTYFNEQRDCLVQQYSNYSVGSNATVDGKNPGIQGQNIADNGGIHAAYNAFRKWKKRQDRTKLTKLPGLSLSQKQLFFVGLGQFFCEYMSPELIQKKTSPSGKFKCLPHKIRLKGIVSNSKEFAKVFHCPTNAPMNPPRKCRLW